MIMGGLKRSNGDGWVQMGGSVMGSDGWIKLSMVQMGKFHGEWVLIDGLGGGWVGLAALGLCFFVLIFLIKGKESFNLF